MGKGLFKPQQIVDELSGAEIGLAGRNTKGEACGVPGVSSQSHYRRRTEYGGVQVPDAEKLRGLQREDSRLRWLVAEQACSPACRSNIRVLFTT